MHLVAQVAGSEAVQFGATRAWWTSALELVLARASTAQVSAEQVDGRFRHSVAPSQVVDQTMALTTQEALLAGGLERLVVLQTGDVGRWAIRASQRRPSGATPVVQAQRPGRPQTPYLESSSCCELPPVLWMRERVPPGEVRAERIESHNDGIVDS